VGGDIPDFRHFLAEASKETDGAMDVSTRQRLAHSYGSSYQYLLRMMVENPALAISLSDQCAVTRGEILHAVRHEMAVCLSDAVLRRTETGSAGHPGQAALEEAARVMGGEIGWNEDERTRQVASIESAYQFDP